MKALFFICEPFPFVLHLTDSVQLPYTIAPCLISACLHNSVPLHSYKFADNDSTKDVCISFSFTPWVPLEQPSPV